MKFAALLMLVACAASPQPRRTRLVYTAVTNAWVPELTCPDGYPAYDRDGAIVGCLHGKIP